MTSEGLPGTPAGPWEATDDRGLVAALVARRRWAMELLYDRWSTTAYSLAVAILGDLSVAEDLVFDAFLRLWLNPQAALTDHDTLRAHLCDVVRSSAHAHHLRGRSTHVHAHVTNALQGERGGDNHDPQIVQLRGIPARSQDNTQG